MGLFDLVLEGKVESTQSLVYIELKTSAKYGAIRLPSESLRKPGVTRVLSENGGKGSDSIELYQAEWVDEQGLLGEADEVYNVSPSWARSRVRAFIDSLISRYAVAGENGGVFVPQNDFAALWDEVREFQNGEVETLREVLIECHEEAFQSYSDRLTRVLETANAQDYFMEMIGKFPGSSKLASSFKLTTSIPRVIPSLASLISGQTDLADQIVQQQRLEIEQQSNEALRQATQQALEDLKQAHQESLNSLTDEICSIAS